MPAKPVRLAECELRAEFGRLTETMRLTETRRLAETQVGVPIQDQRLVFLTERIQRSRQATVVSIDFVGGESDRRRA